jgi:phosphate transport system substrate-binding protein
VTPSRTVRSGSTFVATALLVAACGGTGSATSAPATGAGTEAPATGAAPATAGGPVSLTGAGASFPEPIYAEWIGEFRAIDANVTINYQGIGSGGGREQLIAQSIDFAGSDAFMKDEEITAALAARKCESVLHIPMLFGGVAVAYNLEGLDKLILDGDTIAKIGLGTITTFNDPAIAALNPGVTLPDDAITFVHRSDSSGTTNIFTTYLDDISADWAAGPGKGSEIEWPTGVGGDQNDGVASAISQQPGGLGYVSYEFAVESGIKVAEVVNKDGTPITPSTDSVAAAADSITIPDDFKFAVLGVGGEGYPIVGATWILAYTCGMEAPKADALRAFLTWALSDGDAFARELNYAPLSDALQARVLPQVEKINEEGPHRP